MVQIGFYKSGNVPVTYRSAVCPDHEDQALREQVVGNLLGTQEKHGEEHILLMNFSDGHYTSW